MRAAEAVVVPPGQTSGEVDLRNWEVIAVKFPAGWDGTNLSFTAADRPTAEGGVYGNVTTSSGAGALVPFVITAPAAQDYVVINMAERPGGAMFKLVASTAPAANRTVILVLAPVA